MVADQELETVLVPDDPTQLALAESVLREAGISYATQNSELQHLFGAGEVGGYNPAIGAVAIQVEASNGPGSSSPRRSGRRRYGPANSRSPRMRAPSS